MYKKEKKGQAALEFLMTYGWAILVVLVVIGALAYFGVLDPNSLVPDKCNVEVGLGCLDFKLTAGEVQLYLENGMGRQITINNITVYREKAGVLFEGCRNSTAKIGGGAGVKLNNGEGKSFSIHEAHYTTTGWVSSGNTCNFSSQGKKLKLKLRIDYTNTATNVTHTAKGEILSKVE